MFKVMVTSREMVGNSVALNVTVIDFDSHHEAIIAAEAVNRNKTKICDQQALLLFNDSITIDSD